MKHLTALIERVRKLRNERGFTMIELLIVISILGILAVAVLSAINPLEQINRGRDTATQSDSEQLLNAIERFNAFQGHFPWNVSRSGVPDPAGPPHVAWRLVDDSWEVDTVGAAIAGDLDCTVLDRLGPDGGSCDTGSNELKPSFINRVENLGALRGIYIFKQTDDQNSDMYVCFSPQSSAFQEAARQRCDDTTNPVPIDFPVAACDTANVGNPDAIEMVCLP